MIRKKREEGVGCGWRRAAMMGGERDGDGVGGRGGGAVTCPHPPPSDVSIVIKKIPPLCALFFFFKQKTAYEIGLGIPAEPLFRSQVAIQNRVASNIGISQSTFSVKVLNLFSRSRRKTNKRKSKHSAMLRNKETRHRMFIGLLNTTRKLA